MDDWECTICGEMVPASEIISLNHFRLIHPDLDVQTVERWPDGGLVIHEDPDDGIPT
jgi:hypothetical protein